MQYHLTTYLWFFTIYAFLGWCVEVGFQALTKGIFVNRGFLNGPVCPIYGFGMSILLFFLSALSHNLILLFIGSVILTSALEFVTGFTLEKVFNDKWWDYSDMPFNIMGYISLSFSIMWGLGGVFMIEIIHPFISKFVSLLDNRPGNILIALFITYFLADFMVTLLAILKINKQLRILEEMAARLRLYSEGIGEGIYKRVSGVQKTSRKIHQKSQNVRSEFNDSIKEDLNITELREKFEKLIQEKNYVGKRLEKAYPNIKKRLSRFEDDKKTE